MARYIKMEKGEAVREHKRLIRVLKTGRGRHSEIRRQTKELRQYKRA